MNNSAEKVSGNHKGRLKNRMHDVKALERAIEVCGGKKSILARRLGVSWQTIALWLDVEKGTRITAERALCIEYVTGGKVTRRELRPDLWAPMEEYYQDEVDKG
jgi:DNA-binding transcriptional regulator YdaS (Cro superfamily)